MARRRLTPAQPSYLGSAAGPETKSALAATSVVPPIAQVSGQSAEAAALREVTQGIETARATGRMVVDVPLGDVSQGFLVRDRVALDAAEIAALKASITTHGQRTPAEITPLHGAGRDESDGAPAQPWGLISGWRRLRALSELYEETGEARFSTLRALVRPPEDAAQSYVAMVEENEIRVGLSYYERARVVAEATARGVFADEASALLALFGTASRAKRSKIGSFIDLHKALGDLLNFPAAIPERLGLALVARVKKGDQQYIRDRLAKTRPAKSEEEIKLLRQLSQPETASDVSHAKQDRETLREGVNLRVCRREGRISITLSGPGVDERLLKEVQRALRSKGTPTD